MSKSFPVYNLGQWIKRGDNYGRIVARMSNANCFECLDDYANTPKVQEMSARGAGYCVAWADLAYEGWGTPEMTQPPVVTGYSTRSFRWIRPESMAQKRYEPVEDPRTRHATAPPNGDANTDHGLKPYVDERYVEVLRAMVDAGHRATDWLRAKGLL